MSQAPKFSIIIPTFNREAFISRAIQSVLTQDCQDFEIIVVDDGSTDNTKTIVLSIQDPRIEYVHQQNGGAPKARNMGIDLACGKYIAFLDSDDEFLPLHLSNALPLLEKNRNICTYTQIITNRGNGITFLKPPRALSEFEDISEYLLCDRGFVPTSTLILPTYLAKKVKYDEQMSAGNDVEFAIRLVHSGGKLVMLHLPGAIWYDLGESGRLSSRDNLEERLTWLERMGPIITDRAKSGAFGWSIAKQYANRGQLMKSISLYFKAIRKRCYPPKLALSVLFQILLPPADYRKMANFLIGLGVKL